MKKYKTTTSNGGTTIILDNVQEAISIAESKPYKEYGLKDSPLEDCYEAIEKGNPSLKEEISNMMDTLEDLVDEINPIFSAANAGYRKGEEGVTTTADLLASGDEMCMLRKNTSDIEIKEGAGEGAYRLLINTDVSWWGKETDNAALVGCLIALLQRYATVELWIQQGWLGPGEENGVTLFKLDFPAGFDATQLFFWIAHKGKDVPFSYHINRCLGRTRNGTSIRAEISCDMMLRGDWMRTVGIYDSYDFTKKLYTERCKIIAEYISFTTMKILTGNSGNETYESFEREE